MPTVYIHFMFVTISLCFSFKCHRGHFWCGPYWIRKRCKRNKMPEFRHKPLSILQPKRCWRLLLNHFKGQTGQFKDQKRTGVDLLFLSQQNNKHVLLRFRSQSCQCTYSYKVASRCFMLLSKHFLSTVTQKYKSYFIFTSPPCHSVPLGQKSSVVQQKAQLAHKHIFWRNLA